MTRLRSKPLRIARPLRAGRQTAKISRSNLAAPWLAREPECAGRLKLSVHRALVNRRKVSMACAHQTSNCHKIYATKVGRSL